MVVIQEAGLEGFWIHRVLTENGIESHAVDPASVATSRRRRRAKTDKLDGDTLVRIEGRQSSLARHAASIGLALATPPTQLGSEPMVLDRVKANGGRLKKPTIVALARKLLVALWKYVTSGVVIEGAIVRAA